MPALTIRNIPETTLERLRTRAARGHRSLNGEVLALFEEAVGAAPEGPVYMPPVPLPPKPMFRSLRPGEEPKPLSQAELDRRWAKIQKLRWVDSRSAEEIIADIVGSRTMGREVNL